MLQPYHCSSCAEMTAYSTLWIFAQPQSCWRIKMTFNLQIDNKTVVHIHRRMLCSHKEKNMKFVSKWLELEHILLKEVTQILKFKHHLSSQIQSLTQSLLETSMPSNPSRNRVVHLSFWREKCVFNISGFHSVYLWAQRPIVIVHHISSLKEIRTGSEVRNLEAGIDIERMLLLVLFHMTFLACLLTAPRSGTAHNELTVVEY